MVYRQYKRIHYMKHHNTTNREKIEEIQHVLETTDNLALFGISSTKCYLNDKRCKKLKIVFIKT